MANILKDMKLTSVDLVRSGANQEADICLYKSAEAAESPTEHEKNIFKRFINWLRKNPTDEADEPVAPVIKAEELPSIEDFYKEAITKSIQSIVEDSTLDNESKNDMIAKSISQYHEKMIELAQLDPHVAEPVAEEPPAENPPAEEPPVAELTKADRYDYIIEVSKANPWHGPDGRFTSGPGGAPGGVAARTMRDGGISYHVKSGKEPKTGYMCAVYTDRSQWLKGDDVTDPEKRTAAVKDFMEKNKDVLSDPDNYLGTWYDSSTGNISLDISRNFSDKNEAIKYASEHNEKAIWDVKNMTDIPTGGTGNNL